MPSEQAFRQSKLYFRLFVQFRSHLKYIILNLKTMCPWIEDWCDTNLLFFLIPWVFSRIAPASVLSVRNVRQADNGEIVKRQVKLDHRSLAVCSSKLTA